MTIFCMDVTNYKMASLDIIFGVLSTSFDPYYFLRETAAPELSSLLRSIVHKHIQFSSFVGLITYIVKRLVQFVASLIPMW